MHSTVYFISKKDDSPVSKDEFPETEMVGRGADYWRVLDKDKADELAIKGDCPKFIPVENGMYTLNPEYAEWVMNTDYHRFIDAVKKVYSWTIDDFKAFAHGVEMFDLTHAYSDDLGVQIRGDDDDFGFESLNDFIRWDRYQLKKDGKAPRYYIRGVMDYHY